MRPAPPPMREGGARAAVASHPLGVARPAPFTRSYATHSGRLPWHTPSLTISRRLAMLSAVIRIFRAAALALAGAMLVCTMTSRHLVVHADGGGTCSTSAWAAAAAYDGSSSGSASGGVDAGGYAADACVGLGQTNAIFQAGLACESAGISAGTTSGLGYAVVSWYVVWSDGTQTIVTGPDAPQQYDCVDTFS